MPELRQDPLTGRQVIIAPGRGDRPSEWSPGYHGEPNSLGPFAEGNESATPPEVYAIRRAETAPDTPGWQVRIVPNAFPAVAAAGDPAVRQTGLHIARDAFGVHEVIVESPVGPAPAGCDQGASSQGGMREPAPRDDQELVLRAWRDRLSQLRRDERLAHAIIFKNHGPLAGASLSHPHSQLIATPFVPDQIARQLARCEAYRAAQGRSLQAEILRQELAQEVRLVRQTERFVAYCPYASRFSHEVWIVPRGPASHFDRIALNALEELAELQGGLLGRIGAVLDNPSYNLLLQTAPFRWPENDSFRWYLAICPRVTGIAGYELGTDCFINPVAPELAAARLGTSGK